MELDKLVIFWGERVFPVKKDLNNNGYTITSNVDHITRTKVF